MNLRHRTFVLPALAAAAVLALAGCSGGGDAKDAKRDLPQGPITQRMSDLEKRVNLDSAAAMSTAMDESIAACMKAQGFDYTPQAVTGADLGSDPDMPDWGSEEFAKTYGYGVSTLDDMPGMDATEPYVDDADAPLVEDNAYWEALSGASPDLDEGDDGEAWQPGGCLAQAMTELGLTGLVSSTVAQDIDNLRLQAEEDDAVVTALDGWVSCMADQGYDDYKTSEEAEKSFWDRLYTAEGDPITGADLKALKDEEITTAVADYRCSADVERARAVALARLETDYYDSHKTEVDAYLDQLEELYARG